MKKIEIVVDSLHLDKILAILEKEGVSGYTVIKDVMGKGSRGLMTGDELTNVFKNSYVFTICSDEIAKRITNDISPLIKKYGGICIISDVDVV